MNEAPELIFSMLIFIAFGVVIWLIVTTVIGFVSGWFSLMRRYPDHVNEVPIVKLSRQSGYVGNLFGVMGNVLVLSLCPSGLRVGIVKLLGPYCNDFFVPWNEMKIVRKNYYFIKFAEISFGLDYGKLGIAGLAADRFWRALPDSWPENGTPPRPKTDSELLGEVFRLWLGLTLLASAFFLIVTRITAPEGSGPPVIVAILFPAIFFGLYSLYEYVRRKILNK